MIYLDNAATSWPKPEPVIKAMVNCLERVGGNPGRSGHSLSIDAGRLLYETRECIANFFNAPDPLNVIFTLNVTHAINYALTGILKPGDNVITTSIEHNSIMRPLRALETKGIRLQISECNRDGTLNPDSIAKLVDKETKLVVINHASNVIGTISPIEEVANIVSKTNALLLVDAAQTAGVLPIDIQSMGIDLLAFTGHKGLLGPTGTGGLIIGKKVDINSFEPIIRGGTGSESQYESQPEMLPDKYESGTSNIVGLAGLKAGIEWINKYSLNNIRKHEIKMTQNLLDGLSDIKGITIYGTKNVHKSTAIVSFTIENKEVSEIGLQLDEQFGILCRVGLHCSPATHKTIGTFPKGTIRLAPGIFTTEKDINKTINALKQISVL